MFNEIIFVDETLSNTEPYLGGNPYLPTTIVWPTDSEGRPLLHLATFPAAFINKYVPINLETQLVVSIFTPYSKTSDTYIETSMTEGGKVIAYRPAIKQVSGYKDSIISPKKIISIENSREDSDENGLAKIGGIPSWLQDDESSESLSYILQINNSRLNKAYPDHKSILIGGIGYLLLKKNILKEDLSAGKFLIQTS